MWQVKGVSKPWWINSFQDILDHLPEDPNEIQNPLHLVELMNEKVKTVIESLGGPDKYLEVLNEIIVDKVNSKLQYYVTF